MKYPTLFLGHGAPTLCLEDNTTTRFLSEWPSKWEKPKAIVVVSAHWDTQEQCSVTSWEHRDLIYDFNGFADELYRSQYPAPGSPEIAKIIRDILSEGGYPNAMLDEGRGLDHGSWVPLKVMYPDANLPVLQLSMPSALGPEGLYQIGKALSPLRDEGILFIGSGSAVHNLKTIDLSANGHVVNWAKTFQDWLLVQLSDWNTEDLFNYWQMAPHGVQAHPTDEHLLPLFFAMGCGGSNQNAQIVHEAFMYGSLSMLAVEFS